MEEKNKKIILIIAIIFMVVLTFTYSSNKMKKIKEENTPKNNNVPQETHTPKDNDVPIENYVPKEYEEENIIINEEPPKIESPFKYLDKTLKEMGYTKVNDDKRCLKDETCYSNKVYFIRYGNNVLLQVAKDIKPEKLKNYDSKGDLLLLGKLLNEESLSKRTKIFNELFHKFNHEKGIHNFFLHLDGYMISTYYSLNNTLEYTIAKNYSDINEYDFEYLDTILNDYKSDKANKLRIDLFEFAIKNKKKYFPYYELVNTYLDYGNNNLCSFNIEHEGYIFKSSYCHGGTSNTYYEFTKRENYKNQDTILVIIRPELFEKEYLKMLSRDVKFINNKTDNNFKLTKADLKEVKKVASNTKDSYTFVIDYKLEVTVSFNKNSKFYTIKYVINK